MRFFVVLLLHMILLSAAGRVLATTDWVEVYGSQLQDVPLQTRNLFENQTGLAWDTASYSNQIAFLDQQVIVQKEREARKKLDAIKEKNREREKKAEKQAERRKELARKKAADKAIRDREKERRDRLDLLKKKKQKRTNDLKKLRTQQQRRKAKR